MTFNNKVDSAFQLAEPGDYSGTFGLSAPQLEDGSLEVGSDGVVSWSPDADCAAGTYAVTATYNYSGGLQMKALSLTIEAVELPPAFPFTNYAFSPSPPMPSADWHNDEVVISRQIAGGQYSVDWTYPAWGEGTVTYQLIPGSLGLPSGYTFDTSTGEFTCTVSNADSFMAYDFYVKATDSSGQFDLQHVVIPVTGYYQGQPYLTPYAADGCLEYSTSDESQGYKEITLYDTESFPAPLGYEELVIDQAPAHGTLSDGAYWTDVKYTPTDGFRGVDSFSYHWVYDAYAAYGYNGQPPALIGRYSTNIGHIQIQVGSWVDLAPNDPYAPDEALVGVGGTTTVTLTLQNPRADGYASGSTWNRCPTTGYWQLDFSPSEIRVYNAAGVEILPDSTFLDTVTDEDQITLTVVGVSAGAANLSASWHVWDCAEVNYSNNLVPNWYFYNTDPVTIDVVGVDIQRGGVSVMDKPGSQPTTVIVGQYIDLVGVVEPAGLDITNKNWTVPGNRVRDYNQTDQRGEVIEFVAADCVSDDVRYYWIAGGEGLVVTYAVMVDGRQFSAHATFTVLRPEATLGAMPTVDRPQVNVGPVVSDPNAEKYLHCGRNVSQVTHGITWNGSVGELPGGAGEIAFTQLVNFVAHDTDNSGTSTWTSDGSYVLDNGSPRTGNIGIQYYGAEPIPSGDEAASICRSDTPYFSLYDFSTQLNANEQFKDYLMYKADGGIWVTLRLLTWQWSGAAAKNTAGVWSLVGNPGYRADAQGADSTELPEWGNCSLNLGWVYDQGG